MCKLLSLFFSVVSLFLLALLPATQGDLSECNCDEMDCQADPNCPGEMFLDPCGCCIECAKELMEPCGELDGDYYGQCRQGLICSQTWTSDVIAWQEKQPNVCLEPAGLEDSSYTDSQYSSDMCEATFSGCNIANGVCVCATNLTVTMCESPFEFENQEDCNEALQLPVQSSVLDPPADPCANVFCEEYVAACPPDSAVVQAPLEPGRCCPPSPVCECKFGACDVILCTEGFERRVVAAGSGMPGQCCDEYECVKVDPCANVFCQDYQAECPSDSVATQTPVKQGECCPPLPPCECNMSLCSVLVCTVGYRRELEITGTGEPGSCCDIYKCVKENVTDCSGVVCHGGPLKICPEGTKTIMGGLSEDGCCLLPSRCDCDPGLCIMPYCWPGFAPRLVQEAARVPGDCCDEFECVTGVVTDGCTHEGIAYADGDSWSVNNCKDCECRQGMTHCTVRQSCYHQLCVVEGGFKASGDQWRVDDCTSCECRDGEVACTTSSCKQECLHPRIVPGICCPVCDEPTFITMRPPPPSVCSPIFDCILDCPFGLAIDNWGCPVCQCRGVTAHPTVPPLTQTSPQCIPITCVNSCKNGRAMDERGCPSCQCLPVNCPGTQNCEPCAFGYRVDQNGCETCRCKKCASMDSCHKFCPYGYQLGRNNCMRCRCEKCPPLERCTKQCVHGRDTNDRGCEICKCKNSTTSPSKPTSSHMCNTLSGSIYSDGESWHDGCRECFCHDGREMCALITCPVPACEQPVLMPNFCCPVCVGSLPNLIPPSEPKLQVCHSLEGHFYVEGETWSVDDCTRCVCHNGHVLCSTQECPPLPCASPVRGSGQCCGTCPEDETESSGPVGLTPCVLPENQFVPSGTSWKDDDCTSCQCNNGDITCYHETCPPANCDKPVLRKGQCCATCIDAPTVAVCEYADEVYVDGNTWYASACVTCTCSGGSISCTEVACAVLECTEFIVVKGECCPTCLADGGETTDSNHTGVAGTGKSPGRTKPSVPQIHLTDPGSKGDNGTSSSPTLGNLPPAAINDHSGSPILLIICIVLSCIVIILLLLVLIKRKHRLLYNVNQRQMPIKQPEDPAVTIMSIKPKNTDIKPSNHEPVRDSIRDSKVFKENLANKVNVNSKLDGYEINRYSEKYGGKIDHV